jgi:hypothetical protein
MRPRAGNQSREPREEVERCEDHCAGAVLPVSTQAIDHASVLVQRQALARDRRAQEVAGEPLAPVVVVGLERDLGVERETAERGAQLAGQGERPRVATVGERLERRLATGPSRPRRSGARD